MNAATFGLRSRFDVWSTQISTFRPTSLPQDTNVPARRSASTTERGRGATPAPLRTAFHAIRTDGESLSCLLDLRQQEARPLVEGGTLFGEPKQLRSAIDQAGAELLLQLTQAPRQRRLRLAACAAGAPDPFVADNLMKRDQGNKIHECATSGTLGTEMSHYHRPTGTTILVFVGPLARPAAGSACCSEDVWQFS
jgi:hypothetical protein